eukprot:SAG22_NODE_21314_length_258_cov_0.647799_1_plen_33_part_01
MYSTSKYTRDGGAAGRRVQPYTVQRSRRAVWSA